MTERDCQRCKKTSQQFKNLRANLYRRKRPHVIQKDGNLTKTMTKSLELHSAQISRPEDSKFILLPKPSESNVDQNLTKAPTKKFTKFNSSLGGQGAHTPSPTSLSGLFSCWFVVVRSLSRVQLSVTPRTAARQAPLPFTVSQFVQIHVHWVGGASTIYFSLNCYLIYNVWNVLKN